MVARTTVAQRLKSCERGEGLRDLGLSPAVPAARGADPDELLHPPASAPVSDGLEVRGLTHRVTARTECPTQRGRAASPLAVC